MQTIGERFNIKTEHQYDSRGFYTGRTVTWTDDQGNEHTKFVSANASMLMTPPHLH